MLFRMEHVLRQHLATLTQGFETSVSGANARNIGRRAVNDSRIFERLAEGHGFNIRTYDRLVEWFSANWPSDVDWPDGIERPAVQPQPVEEHA